jgi:hypothetical protein
MKITREELKQIIKEELQKEVSLKQAAAGLGAAAMLGGVGIGAGKMVTKGSYSEEATDFSSRLTKSAKKAIFNAVNQGQGDYNNPQAKVVFDMNLPKLIDDGRLTHEEDKSILKIFLDNKHIVTIDKNTKISSFPGK